MAASESPIKTVVVLVQENRSFDHMLGWMNAVNPQINGVNGTESNPLPPSDRVFFSDKSVYVEPDPGHSIQDIFEQIFGVPWTAAAAGKNPPPAMQGFAQNAERKGAGWSAAVMNGFKPDALPVYKELVQEFAVCDRWFAAVPASTQPNRLYVHSATSHGATSNDTWKLIEGFPQKTIFESLEEGGGSFGIYYQYPPATLFYRNLRKLKYILNNFHQFDLDFEKHCKEGKLPNYVVVEQRYFDLKILPGNDDHPSHDVFEGQKFVKKVYEALRSSPQWNEILFIIIYDEHGGFFDHVPTPVAGVPSPDGLVGPEPYKFQFDRLGVRVPAIMISPWIEKGTVLHGPSGPYPTSEFEHSSIAATVKKIFNLKEFLTKRDAWAGTFDIVLNRTSPRLDCPEPTKLREAEAQEEAKLSEFQEEMVQMSAVLCGDHKKDDFPRGIVDGMTVARGAEYVNSAFKKFLNECEKGKNKGADESTICIPGWDDQQENSSTAKMSETKPSRSFASKFFSCLVCGGGNGDGDGS
ncbi:non-specific phospholipase C4-like isoform X2 [Andrographis paniculata]|uniref:non-specific phospholipase C4-like isoform X2 n=1 Tax=Andrographis paniculata TaxID=175694 RepID=UPI0021E97C83|nr:non-specific phospholipase C4-like isoform X2 [Andrographis paniculata]